MSKPPAPKKTRVGHQTVDLYQFVIDDTVSRVKGEFVQEGIAEDVLDELRSLWETALSKTGVCEVPEEEEEPEPEAYTAPPGNTAAPAYKQEPVSHHQGLPPHMMAAQPRPPAATAPAAQPRPPPQVLQSNPPAQANYMQYPQFQQMTMQQLQQLQQQQQQQQYMHPGGAWPMPTGAQYTPQQIEAYNQHILAHAHAQQQHQQAPYMPQMQQPGNYAAMQAPMNPQAPPHMASLAGQKRSLEETGISALNPAAKQHNTGNNGVDNPTIPQQDGPADDGAAPASTAAAAAGGGEEDEDGIGPGDSGDELNEGDDLADVDDHEEIDEDLIKDVMLGQFEKVHRSKAKWKVNLKNCVATINGVDYLLKKVTGEMNF